MYLCHIWFRLLQIRTPRYDSCPPHRRRRRAAAAAATTACFLPANKHFLNATRWLERDFLLHQHSASQRKSRAAPQLHHEEYIQCAPFTPEICAFEHITHIPAETSKTSWQNTAFLMVFLLHNNIRVTDPNPVSRTHRLVTFQYKNE